MTLRSARAQRGILQDLRKDARRTIQSAVIVVSCAPSCVNRIAGSREPLVQ
jgi:hypothetical protein